MVPISIHAPSRERFGFALAVKFLNLFQSTLPRGSDSTDRTDGASMANFNPRSLAGASELLLLLVLPNQFQSTLPRGSDRFRFGSQVS